MKRKSRFNPVAKHARSFNKATVFKDRKKALKRGEKKHKSVHSIDQNHQIAA